MNQSVARCTARVICPIMYCGDVQDVLVLCGDGYGYPNAEGVTDDKARGVHVPGHDVPILFSPWME